MELSDLSCDGILELIPRYKVPNGIANVKIRTIFLKFMMLFVTDFCSNLYIIRSDWLILKWVPLFESHNHTTIEHNVNNDNSSTLTSRAP